MIRGWVFSWAMHTRRWGLKRIPFWLLEFYFALRGINARVENFEVVPADGKPPRLRIWRHTQHGDVELEGPNSFELHLK